MLDFGGEEEEERERERGRNTKSTGLHGHSLCDRGIQVKGNGSRIVERTIRFLSAECKVMSATVVIDKYSKFCNDAQSSGDGN